MYVIIHVIIRVIIYVIIYASCAVIMYELYVLLVHEFTYPTFPSNATFDPIYLSTILHIKIHTRKFRHTHNYEIHDYKKIKQIAVSDTKADEWHIEIITLHHVRKYTYIITKKRRKKRKIPDRI